MRIYGVVCRLGVMVKGVLYVVLCVVCRCYRRFVGILFVFVVSLYGIFFKVLHIDLLRLKKQPSSYWLDTDKIKQSTIFKQY